MPKPKPAAVRAFNYISVDASVKIDAADIAKLPPANARALLMGIGKVAAAANQRAAQTKEPK